MAQFSDAKDNKFNDKYETMMLMQALTKIGKLLSLSFGEAGAEIIG